MGSKLDNVIIFGAIILLLAILTFLICMIVGDIYISKIAFETQPSINCITTKEDIVKLIANAKTALTDAQKPTPTTTAAPTVAGSTTTTTTPVPTITSNLTVELQVQINELQRILNNFDTQTEADKVNIYRLAPPTTINRAIILDENQFGFARFKVIINWMLFILLTCLSIYCIVYIRKRVSKLVYILSIILISFLWLVFLVGGIFISKYVFTADKKKCNSFDYYNYNLTDSGLDLVKIYSILSFLITFGMIPLVYIIYNKY